MPREDGNARAGRETFRFATFGDEDFWTDAVRLLAAKAGRRRYLARVEATR